MTSLRRAPADPHSTLAVQDLVSRAVGREPHAANDLVSVLLPTIRARVVRALFRYTRGRRASRCVAQEVDDLCQDVLVALFEHDARALRAWSPHRGGLEAFVSIVTEHEVASVMRSSRRRPWRDEEDGSVDVDALRTLAEGPESIVAFDELLAALVEGLRAQLTPNGLALFRALVLDGQSVAEVRAATSMTRDAVYASRARHLKLVRKLLGALSDEPQVAFS